MLAVMMNQMRCTMLAFFFSVPWVLGQSSFAEFPFGQGSSISPDGSFTLKIKVCQPNQGDCDKRLWLVNNRTNIKKVLIEVQRTALVGWGPSGSAFFLNDDFGSNGSSADMYFPAEGRHFNINELLDKQFPQDRRFEENSHHYIKGVRWISADKLLVRRNGHFDRNVPAGNEFSVCYSVSSTGRATRISETHHENSPCKIP
jgi:hypothetical protein